VELTRRGINARKIINRKGIENAFRLGAAMGGSTNLALHIPAIAYEAECPEIDVDALEAIAHSTPHITKVNPASPYNIPDFHAAGGVPATMKEILPLLHGDAMTVTGKTWAENLAPIGPGDRRIIRPLSDPWSTGGALAVLRGNLAPRTAITKPAAIAPSSRSSRARPGASTAKRRPSRPCSTASCARARWWSFATRVPRVGPACGKCTRR